MADELAGGDLADVGSGPMAIEAGIGDGPERPDSASDARTRVKRVSNPGGALIDVNAKAKLTQAAASIGLALEEMVNLVVDSGMVALPPEDGITEQYTFEDLGLRMWNEMNQMTIDKQPMWFEKLVKNQQVSLLITLRHKGLSCYRIAENLGLHAQDVNRIWNQFSDKVGAQVTGLRLNTIAGNLQLIAERCMEGLSEERAHAQVWKIQKELVAMFQTIGIVDKAAQRIEHTHAITDERQREIQKMIDLERKKEVRTEEIKRIDVQIMDPVPSLDAVEEMPF